MTQRNYRNNLDFVGEAFRACWANSQDLVNASRLLLDNGHHAQSLSLAVLAVEELGKLFCVDGLLFARVGDEKAKVFAKSLKRHDTKLQAFELIPLLLVNVASVDPRYGSEQKFRQAIAISVNDLKNRGNTVLDCLVGGGFGGLDGWKQCGFYAQPLDAQNAFQTPREAVDPKLAEAVHLLAWRASSTMDFVLKAGNLERYIATAKSIRARMSDSEQQRILELTEDLVKELFPLTVEAERETDSLPQ